MKLYTAMLSPFAARVRMQIYAKGLEVEMAEAFTDFSVEQLAQMNPMGKLPVLEDGDLRLPESTTICEYIEDRHPSPALRPSDPAQLARMRVLERMADFYVFEPLSPLFAHLSRKHRQQEVVDRQLALLQRGLGALEHYIPGEGCAIGTQLSLADCALVPILLFVQTYLPYFAIEAPLQPYPRLQAYGERMANNEHAARVIAEIRAAMKAKAGG